MGAESGFRKRLRGSKEAGSAASWRQRSVLVRPSGIFQTVSPRPGVNKAPADVPGATGWHHAHGVVLLDKRELVRSKLLCRWRKRRTRPSPAAYWKLFLT